MNTLNTQKSCSRPKADPSFFFSVNPVSLFWYPLSFWAMQLRANMPLWIVSYWTRLKIPQCWCECNTSCHEHTEMTGAAMWKKLCEKDVLFPELKKKVFTKNWSLIYKLHAFCVRPITAKKTQKHVCFNIKRESFKGQSMWATTQWLTVVPQINRTLGIFKRFQLFLLNWQF